MINGIININKEKGYTSHDVVAKMRGILKIKKIGHTGTLDPDAEGVLPICIGKATKLVDLIVEKDKTYEAILKLGVVTDTQDMSGTILGTSKVNVSLANIKDAVEGFIGGYNQIPPMYSAKKINGKKLYELARQGKEVERIPRWVDIHSVQILDYDPEEYEAKLLVSCGKGTYIRTLLYDVGEVLGCGGAMKALVRTRVGSFSISESLRLDQVEEYVRNGVILDHITKIDDMLLMYPKVIVDSNFNKLIYNGNSFQEEHLLNLQEFISKVSSQSEHSIEDILVRVYDSDEAFIGIYNYDLVYKRFTAEKMFL